MTKLSKIAFITSFFEDPKGGVGNYEQSLFPHLAEKEDVQQIPIQPYPLPEWSFRVVSLFNRDLRAFTKNFPFYIERGYPLVHLSNEILAFALLFYRSKSIVTVHHLPDLRSIQFRQEVGKLWWLYALAMVGIRRATRVIVDSRWTGSQVASRLRIPQERIDVIPLGVNHLVFHPGVDTSGVKKRYHLGKGPHILYVGGMDERKNLPILFNAFMKLRESIPSAELLLIGPKERGLKKLSGVNESMMQNCRLLGFVPTEDLVKFYNLATVFVMPSKLEGFGLPVLEAMACGCPVVVSSAAALPEVAGTAGIYFDPDDEKALLESIRRVLLDPDLRDELSMHSRQQAALFDWKTTANLTIASYHKTFL